MTLRDRLRPILSQLEAVPSDEVPAALGAIAEAQAKLLGRLGEHSSTLARNSDRAANWSEADELLTATQAALRLGVSKRWVYAHAASLPFARRLSSRVLRFSTHGLERWQAARKP